MKVLMFGRGVISTQYGWALERAGHDVTFYVRPGRRAAYGPVVNLDLLDGRKNKKGDAVIEQWPITMYEEIDRNHAYDLIIISVNHNQLEEAVEFIVPRVGEATILIFNNIWADPITIERKLPKGQVLWGFPGAGGGYYDQNTLRGGFMKTIFLESEATAASLRRHRQVAELFATSGFFVSIQKSMKDWLWGHFIMNVAMSAEAMKVGGHSRAFQSRDSLREMILLMREMIPLIKAKGGKLDTMTRMLSLLPTGLSATIIQKSSAEGSLSGEIMRRMENSGHATPQMNYDYIQPVLEEAKKLSVELPRLTALHPYYNLQGT